MACNGIPRIPSQSTILMRATPCTARTTTRPKRHGLPPAAASCYCWLSWARSTLKTGQP